MAYIPVVINGIEYKCMSDAIKALGYTGNVGSVQNYIRANNVSVEEAVNYFLNRKEALTIYTTERDKCEKAGVNFKLAQSHKTRYNIDTIDEVIYKITNNIEFDSEQQRLKEQLAEFGIELKAARQITAKYSFDDAELIEYYRQRYESETQRKKFERLGVPLYFVHNLKNKYNLSDEDIVLYHKLKNKFKISFEFRTHNNNSYFLFKCKDCEFSNIMTLEEAYGHECKKSSLMYK